MVQAVYIFVVFQYRNTLKKYMYMSASTLSNIVLYKIH